MLTPDALAAAYQAARPDLVHYLSRMVLRAEIAEELAQEAAFRLVTADHGIADVAGVRPWLFRVGSRLAIDYLRLHSTQREEVLVTARRRADASETFRAESHRLIGSPEVAAIAREHLTICLACTMRNLEPERAAVLLLVELHGFSVAEAAEVLDCTFGQAKHWLQAGREQMRQRYDATCALVNKQGVCHQCSELNEYFNGQPADPLDGTAHSLDDRLAIARTSGANAPGRWHVMMLRLVDDLLGAAASPGRPAVRR